MRDTDTSCDGPGWLGIGHKWWTLAVAGLIYMTCLGLPQEDSPEMIAHAVRVGMRVTAAFALVGAVSSAVRGQANLANNG